MDFKVKSLLTFISSCSNVIDCQKYIRETYAKILENDEIYFTTDTPQMESTKNLIECIDLAIKYNVLDVAEECSTLFFTRASPKDPNRCFAYLYMAKLSIPKSIYDIERLEKASVYITKAVNLAASNPALSNEILEASLIYWEICHPFLRNGFYHYISNTLHVIVEAVIDLKNASSNWKAILMVTLVDVFFKVNRKNEALEIAKKVFNFTKRHAPSLFNRLLELMVRYQISDYFVSYSHLQHFPDLAMLLNIFKLNNLSDTRDVSKDISKIMTSLGIITGIEEDANITLPHKSKFPSSDRTRVLLELTRLCLKNNLVKYARICVDTFATMNKGKNKLCTLFKFAECEIMVKLFEANHGTYERKSVETRLKAIELCEENIVSALKQHDGTSVQCGCVTLWNLSLPLLQSNLRHHLFKPLTLVAKALDDIKSLFLQLRCQVHLELALCEERDHLEIAIAHLKKAIYFDNSKTYHNQLMSKLNQLTLLSEIHVEPTNPEDIASKIIEQAREFKSKGTKDNMHALLVKAGSTLSPDAFQKVLDSESLLSEKIKVVANMTNQLAFRAKNYNANINKIEGHLLRIGDKNDFTRMCLWADLSKVARRHGIWDVCRVAAMFCLLYDDNRWLPSYKDMILDISDYTTCDITFRSDDTSDEILNLKKKRPLPEKLVINEKENTRILAEMNFMQGEACLNLLYQENVKLNDLPVYPHDYSKHGKNYEVVNPDEDEDWVLYCQWIQQINSKITSSFLRGMNLGCNLNESYIVANGATYLWNYNRHIIEQNRQSEIVACFTAALDGITKIDFSEFIPLFLNICINLALGIMIPYMQPIQDKIEDTPNPSLLKKSNPNKNQPKIQPATVSPGIPDLKKSIEICEYAIDISNKKRYIHSTPSALKASLLKIWVIAKQLMQQQIFRSMIKDEDLEKQTAQIIIDIEMHTYTKNGIMEFKDLQPLGNLVSIMFKHQWKDNMLKLQLFTRVADILYNNKNYDLVIKVAKTIINSYQEEPTQYFIKTSNDSDIYHVKEKISYLYLLMGESLTWDLEKQVDRWEAVNYFLTSAEFSISSHNYQILMKASKSFWNSIQSLIHIRSERKVLESSLQKIISYISKVRNKITELNSIEKSIYYVPEYIRITPYGYIGKDPSNEPIEINGDDDQKVLVSLYNVLCDSYEDSNNWEMVSKTLNSAINDLPRNRHRIQFFLRRIMVKAKLGKNLLLDLQRFRDEKEDFLSLLWHNIALHSTELSEQCIAYQNAIESLSCEEYNWQKIDYLIEFGEWLYTYQMPVQIVVDQIEWAIDILISMTPGLKKENLDVKPRKSRKYCTYIISEETQRSNSFYDNPSIYSYIPKEKEILIGAPIQDCSNATEKMYDVKQLNYLIKCCVILCEIYTPASPLYQRYSLMAYTFTMKLWQVCISAALSFVEPEMSKCHLTSKESKKKNAESVISLLREKNRKKFLSITDTSLLTVEDWAMFEIPPDFARILKNKNLEMRGFNENNFPQPMLSLYYLNKLVINLKDIGFPHLTFPVLALSHYVALFLAHSKSFVLYTHCLRVEICAALNLRQCSSLHESIINETSEIDPNELIKMQEKFREYIQEGNNDPEKSETTPHKCHLGHYFDGNLVYQIWTMTAEALIELTHYELARKYLCEAYKFAIHFKDIFYQGRLCFLQAKLAFVEAQYKESFDLCMKAEEIMIGDKEIWCDTTMLKTDAALLSFPENGAQLAEQFLQNIIKELNKLILIRPNQAVGYGYTVALIQAKLGEVKIKYSLKQLKKLNSTEIHEAFKSSLKYFDISTEYLLRNNFTSAAIKVMQSHANMRHEISLQVTNNNMKSYYLGSIKIYIEAIKHAETKFHDLMKLLPKDFNLSLPIQRELSCLQRKYAEVLVEIQTIHTNETINGENIEHKEEFINPSPGCLAIEKEWICSKKWVAIKILSLATSAHYLAKTMPWIKSRCLLIIGKCLLNLSLLKQSRHFPTWSYTDIDKESLYSDGDIEFEETKKEECLFDKDIKKIPALPNKTIEAKWMEDISLCYLCQAVECLTQALQTAFPIKLTDVIMQSSYELMNLVGQFDQIFSSNFLALFQSCWVSLYLKKLLKITQLDPHKCRLAALMFQRKHLLNNYSDKNLICTDAFYSVTNSLENEWKAWKNTLVLTNHFDISHEFPNNFNFVILQHSPDKNYLFSGLLDKMKSVKGNLINKQQSNIYKQQTNVFVNLSRKLSMIKYKVNREDLQKLQNMMKVYNENLKFKKLERVFKEQNIFQFKGELEPSKSSPCKIFVDTSEDFIEEKFQEIVWMMEEYLAPVSKYLRECLSTVTPLNTTNKDASEKVYIIIVADPELLELPLEALGIFHEFPHVISVTRDVSFQLFYHRFNDDSVDELKMDKKKDKISPKIIFSRIPGNELPKKKGKKEKIDSEIPSLGQNVNSGSMKYIVDSYYDFDKDGEVNYCESFRSILSKYEATHTSKWIGLLGDTQNASSGEWENYLCESGSFIFFAPNKLTSHIAPSKLPVLNISKCMLLCQFDLSDNYSSYRRQSFIDELKPEQISNLEAPVSTALLLSLGGVRCIMSNQWYCEPSNNLYKLQTIMKYLLSSGLSAGEALRCVQDPYSKVEAYVNNPKKKQHKTHLNAENKSPTNVPSETTESFDNIKNTSILDGKEPNCYNMVCYGLPNIFIT